MRAHALVGLDTSIFIYRLESSARYRVLAAATFDAIVVGLVRGVTCILALMELVVKPLQLGRPDIAESYEDFLTTFPNLMIADIDRVVARSAAELRAAYRLDIADALHLAVCLRTGATAFLTNDRDLRRVRELEVLLLDDFVDG